MATQKFIVLVLISVVLSLSSASAQNNVPRNLKETASFLNLNVPDSLKNLIKGIKEEEFEEFASDELQNDFELIDSLLSARKSLLFTYLNNKGIHNFKKDVVLEYYKLQLSEGYVKEDSLLKVFKLKGNKLKKEIKQRMSADTIAGIYIPKNLEDCFVQIDSFWDDSTKNKVREMTESEFTAGAHFGFGMWMRNNWGLWGGSRLSVYFNKQGIRHPDDMSGIILTSYYRKLKGKDPDVKSQLKYYKKYWTS
ncbi:DUF6794 domain-containing protein [Sphingobacterium ginsenosidimutans]|uniref:DUF6794 domain-containing protein n=1 Tax=Sphingobacterium ginsenosidimutans TaxID=687845 RepID=A0ABP7ZX84_9SPHI